MLITYLSHTKLVAGTVAMALSFVLGELVTGQAVLAGMLALGSAALAAWLASRPALIQARVATATLEETQEERREKRAERLHQDEVDFLQERIRFHSQSLILVRISKHNVIEYSQIMTMYVHELRKLLEEGGVTPPPFTFKTYDELCGDEDRALAHLALPPELHSAMEDVHGK